MKPKNLVINSLAIFFAVVVVIFAAYQISQSKNAAPSQAGGLPSWISGKQGTIILGAQGGAAPFSCALKAGSTLPPWLTLSPDCNLTGKAPILAAGSTRSVLPSFIVSVTDSANPPRTQDVSMTIQIVESAPQLIPIANNQCTVNQFCTVQVATAQGGVPPYSFYPDTFREGFPPLGMILDSNGVLTGTPRKIGTYNFGACVKDTVSASTCGKTSVEVVAQGAAAVPAIPVAQPPAAQPAPAAAPPEKPTITASVTCTSNSEFFYTGVFSVSVSGPVGTYILNSMYVGECGAWGKNCKRDSGEPASTSWEYVDTGRQEGTYTLRLSACSSECAEVSTPVACE